MVQLSVVYGSETWSVKNGYEKTEYMGEENICVECLYEYQNRQRRLLYTA